MLFAFVVVLVVLSNTLIFLCLFVLLTESVVFVVVQLGFGWPCFFFFLCNIRFVLCDYVAQVKKKDNSLCPKDEVLKRTS